MVWWSSNCHFPVSKSADREPTHGWLFVKHLLMVGNLRAMPQGLLFCKVLSLIARVHKSSENIVLIKNIELTSNSKFTILHVLFKFQVSCFIVLNSKSLGLRQISKWKFNFFPIRIFNRHLSQQNKCYLQSYILHHILFFSVL